MQQLMSANRLRDGTVVYLAPDGEWVTDIAAATVFTSAEGFETGRAKAQGAVAANLVVDPVAVDITDCAGKRRATTLRNTIRALGPTVDFGVSSPAAVAVRGRHVSL